MARTQKDNKLKKLIDKNKNKWKKQKDIKRIQNCDVRAVSHSCDVFFNLTCSDTLQKIKMCFRIGVGIIEHVNRPSQTASKVGALLTISDGSGFNP